MRDNLDVDRYNELINQVAEYFSKGSDDIFSNEIIINIVPASKTDTFEKLEYDFVGL